MTENCKLCTDEDLKQVRVIQEAKMKTVTQKCCTICDKYLDDLFVRLKAAERVCKITSVHEGIGQCQCTQCDVLAEWRKAAGK